MSITSFDHFIETLEHVPAELQRNFSLMADLDKRADEIVKRIDECVREYRKSDKKDERLSLFKESMDLFDRARAYADDKVDLAKQTYDLVDKHIRRLESLSGAQIANDVANGQENAKQVAKKQKSGSAGKTGPSSGQTAGLLPEPLAVDMPLDPNEPKYCTCHQVSFGEMIACDNESCPIEWFHFPCVELKTKPNGKWYCPECFNINKKGKHKSKRQKT